MGGFYMEQRRKDARHEPINEKDPPQGGGNSQNTVDKTVSTTDPDCGMFVKGEHERQFAYEAHTGCDKRGFVLGVEAWPQSHDGSGLNMLP